MKIDSINIGRPEALDPERPDKRTGINKRPVDGPVAISRFGIGKDAVVDTRHHGGPDQALYLYTAEDYRCWADAGVRVEPGHFGENLTISGFESAALCIGDRLKAGGVVLEVTACRIPCATFAAKMGDPQFVRKFRDAGRPGAYLRVLAEGQLRAGQALELVPFPGETLTVGAHFALTFRAKKTPPDRETIERLLALPIAERARADARKWLAAQG